MSQKSHTKVRGKNVLLAAALAAIYAVTSPFAYAEGEMEFNIPAEDLASSLKKFGQQSGVQIMFAPETVENLKAPALLGRLQPVDALKALLKDSGLTFEQASENLILVQATKPSMRSENGSPLKRRLSQGNDSPSPAMASDSSSRGALEEIIVTAQKREEKLQDVPTSLAVASGEQLQAANVDSIAELQRIVPGFTLKTGTDSNNSVLFVRGVGTLVSSNAIQPTVATVIDGVVMGRSGIALFNFDDVARLEVLRGPQGTLFGMNASGGVLNLVTKQPTNELSGNFGVGYGSYNEIKANGAVSGALVDNVLLGRLSFFTDRRDGYIRNVASGEDVNDENQKGVRGKLLYMPREETKITLSADAVNSNRNCCVATDRLLDTSPIASLFPITAAHVAATGGFAREGNHFINGQGRGPFTRDRVRGASIQWDESLGEYTLTSITAYRSWSEKGHNTLDLTPTFDVVRESNTSLKQHQWSQELRIASPQGGFIDYVGGLFFFKQRVTADNDSLYDLTAYLFPVFAHDLDHSVTDTLNYAAFGDANLHITDIFTLIGGARWTREKVDLHLVGLPRDPSEFPFGVPPGTVDDSVTVSNWSGRFGMRWEIDADNMLYAMVSRGYKGPGYNSISGLPGVSQRVDPEIATNYEIGVKSQLFDRRVRTNVAVFYETFRDFQAQGLVGAPPTVVNAIINAGKLQSKGVELEIEALPVDDLTLNLSAAYIDAKFKEFPQAPCFNGQVGGCDFTTGTQNLAGKPLSSVPKWSANLSGRYDFPLGNTPFLGFVRAEYSWRDKVQWDIFQNPLTISSSNGQIGASLGINDRDDKYTVTVYGKNLGNKVPQAPLTPGGVTGQGATQLLSPDYKRIYGVNLEYRF